MKKVLKMLRKNLFLNRLISSCLRSTKNIIESVQNHWPVSGQIDLTFDHHKIKYYTEGDDHVANALYYGKSYESLELRLFLKYASQSKAIFDIGANTGLYTCLASVVNSSATIFSFEPNPVNHSRLEKNIEINNFKNIIVCKKAIGDSNENVVFAIPETKQVSYTSSVNLEFSKSTHKDEIKWTTISVPQISIDEYIYVNDVKNIDLIKIDVEGYELPVLKGAKQLIENHRPVIFCELFFNKEVEDFLLAFLTDNDYHIYSLLDEGLLLNDINELQVQKGNNYVLSPKNLGGFVAYESLF